ncbi:4-hydroxythreonine-4-phosphate dehydrogenase PdxA [Candidatus Velamenicoccus archaeovorus]|uniref:4-hydroxythreonine-4-phosphate dehydrogenase PdxA n=1 Tax=Velamenicoccus archaeovorus TaxID=1930593 RepID=A0A410P4P0_VELA1|nr:4-hydroxythreonine-4-phosphate dehydrogenase PdxA [Candidatus Velamenicoccus archaeovorus]QAT17136.1 4-hydroxythreonine-4-phosphate dehydrogenase PdxA [Candidatus Velamenicoccus archaeovorus]
MKTRIAVTMGDPAGIGAEVLVKALRRLKPQADTEFHLIGDACILRRHGFRPAARVCLHDMAHAGLGHLHPGKPSRAGAKAAYGYLKEAVRMVRAGQADGLVTAPISKEVLRSVGFRWAGHTEFLAHALGASQVEMVFVSSRLRVVLVTRHMSLACAVRAVKKDRIVACGLLIYDFLRRTCGLASPRIAVCGLNPHAGEKGLFGKEEITQIAPAVKQLNRLCRGAFSGPAAADALFHRAWDGACDMVMAMYHDQGLIPFKMTEFSRGVHVTAGLPVVRTSPVHGTAYDIAGKNKADEGSMLAALELACDLAGLRRADR